MIRSTNSEARLPTSNPGWLTPEGPAVYLTSLPGLPHGHEGRAASSVLTVVVRLDGSCLRCLEWCLIPGIEPVTVHCNSLLEVEMCRALASGAPRQSAPFGH